MQELPERTTEIVRIMPTSEQLDLSNEHVAKAARIAAKQYLTEMDLLQIQKHLLMARMAANSTFLVDKEEPGYSSKLDRLAELFEQLAAEGDRKIVLFSEWTTMLGLIEPVLQRTGLDFVRLDGKVPQKRRQELVHRFQNDQTLRAIIMSNAGSTGLNLQAANTVINVDLPWNPAVLEQRISRAHRMGQKQPVQVYVLITEQTIEERLLGLLSAKHDLALAALDVESSVSQVELKRRLERLLGDHPLAPIDASQQRQVEAETRAIAARREKVAAASGELLGAALNLVGELIDTGHSPAAAIVEKVRTSLAECLERDELGRPQIRVTLPNDQSLQGLAETLAKLLVTDQSP
jgi:superfamily II DNA/RNA helicase